ncbi:hypothetical protein K2173_013873 [Erythroxylum novogranatense]|uniref:PHD-type domain-containing protein n=1 Tax=Erythroxylum novogranatense TaxID=1862640 RepID=A0AAV8SD37_9ROSI|nr:hypothetical protein K2173_013873 [Erythroxylum novogranatense]
MELTDSTELPTTRSPLVIDLNEIPSSSTFSPSTATRRDRDFSDPSTGTSVGEDRALECNECGKPVADGRLLLCDGCDKGFHLDCAGIGRGTPPRFEEWLCGKCVGGDKIEKWRLGVHSRLVLDINASPPSDIDGERGNAAKVLDFRGDGCPSLQESLHVPKKRKSKGIQIANVYSESKENSVNGYHGELSFSDQGTETVDAESGKVAEVDAVSEFSNSHQSREGLPVQFEDFFVLSLGKIDVRPAYHSASLIWPIGYSSCWHDKVTGSFFICKVLDGGDSGPLFSISRFPCSALPVPEGATVLYRKDMDQLPRQNNNNCMVSHNKDFDNDVSVEAILADPSPPTESDILNCLLNSSNGIYSGQRSDHLRSSNIHARPGRLQSNNLSLVDEIGEITVENCSSTAAWKMVSANLISAYSELCNQRGTIQISCKHVGDEWGSTTWDMKDEKSMAKFSPLAKFCSSLCLFEIPPGGELETLVAALSKWLDEDRFGLDTEFVQEMIEQLPGVESCSQYQFLLNRGYSCTPLTVGSGQLTTKRKRHMESDESCRKSKSPRLVEEHEMGDLDPPPGTPLCSRLAPVLVGDFYQVWELLRRFHQSLGLKESFTMKELEEALSNPCYDVSNLIKNSEGKSNASEVLDLCRGDKESQQDSSSFDEFCMACNGDNLHSLVPVDSRKTKESTQNSYYSSTALTKAHSSLLGVVISELQWKVAALVDPNFDSGEWKARRGRRKDSDSSIPIRSKLNMLPINDLTWQELARRYMLAVLSMDCNTDSSEITARESGKVFRCLQGDGGVLCGALTGVAGMEADALLLADAKKKNFGCLTREKDVITIEEEVNDANAASEMTDGDDGGIPEWAKVLQPVKKLPTNVGTRIRRCVYDALEKSPPEWAKKRLEHSISKEVYKGNASGPTKKAVLSVLADLPKEALAEKSARKIKRKIVIPVSDIVMKKCRIVLRRAAAADDTKVFCTLLGRNLLNSGDNDDEGLLGSPAMVSRPLDFRTIDLRLEVGAYGGSYESFLEDVRELWKIVQIAFGDQPDLVELATRLAHNFESLYKEEVGTLLQKFEGYAKLDYMNEETKNELDNILISTNEIPKAPWDEGVCKVCGVDKDDDSVLLCDTCDAEYHTYCLNPPLARIPEGNWYCPSCVGFHMVQEVSGNTRVIGKGHCKKFKGEFNNKYLKTLTHLAVAMEEKDYWELGVDERVFLLKFLCDELLSTTLIHQHLEQCAETTAELQQKMRSQVTEWRSLKSREEFLVSRAAKKDIVAVVDLPLKEGLTSATSNQAKGVGQLPNMNGGDHCSTFSVDSPAVDCEKDGKGIDGINRKTSGTNSDNISCCNNQTLDGMDGGSEDGGMHATDDNKISLLENGNTGEQNHLYQVTKETSEIQVRAKLQGYISVNDSTSRLSSDNQGFYPTSENIHVAQHGSPAPVNECQAPYLELSSLKNDILCLQNTILRIEAQLEKQSLRREFLGSDSRGRLYWASSTLDMLPRVIVDGSLTLQHREKSDEKDVLESGHIDSTANCIEWVCYETDAEIKELIDWLNDEDQKERQLKESIWLWMKLRFQGRQEGRNQFHEEHQRTLSTTSIDDKITSNCLVSKAAMHLEKKYGAFIELGTKDTVKRRVKKARLTGENKMWRCDCLEPILPSRHHCASCHRTFTYEAEFEDHNNDRCNVVPPAPEKNEERIDFFKAKGDKKSMITKENCNSENRMPETSIGGHSELRSKLIQFQDTDAVCPFDLKEITSKFVTENSVKELVKEVGLIGSNGILSFVRAVPPYLSDSMLTMVSSHKGLSIQDDEFNVDDKPAKPDSLNQFAPNSSFGQPAPDEIHEVLKSGKPHLGLLEQRDLKSCVDKSVLQVEPGCCCVVPKSSLRPLIGKGSVILRQLKVNLLDMEAALPEEALRSSRSDLEKRLAWRSHVKFAESIYEVSSIICSNMFFGFLFKIEFCFDCIFLKNSLFFQMVQATIILEDMIKMEFLRNEWWYWSSLSAAARTSTITSLALRIYSLDAAILYDRMSNSNLSNSLKPSSLVDQKSLPSSIPVDEFKQNRKSNKKT